MPASTQTGSDSLPKARNTPGNASQGSSTLVYLSYAAVYIIWGSTFFAIRIAIETLPAILVPALRHLAVGMVFFPVFRSVSGERPNYYQWRTAVLVGVLLLAMGNGGVSWAEKIVPSGIAALLVSTVSLWMVLIDWLRPGGVRPGPRVLGGLVLGFAGMVLLVGPGKLGGSDRVSPLGAVVLIAASLAWAAGSIYSKHHPLPRSPLLGTGMQCLAGGVTLLLATVVSGELHGFRFSQVSSRSWLALGYLAIFGSAVGFSAYVYILKHSSATRVATYAFVNPVVALILGWSFGGEALSPRTMLASGIILAAVLLVITAPRKSAIEVDESVPAPGEA